MLSDRLRPNIECAPWIIDEIKNLENCTRIVNGTLCLSDARSIISSSVDKTMSYYDINGNTVSIPTRTIMRMYSILEFELKRENKSVEKFYNEL